MEFVSHLFWLVFWAALILGGIALFSYNKLQRLAQEIHERASNVQIAISKKLNLINQLIDVVRSHQEGEQFLHLKISQDRTAASLVSAYQQSGSLLASLQGMAERSPDVKNNQSYARLIDSIQHCELDIQQARQSYNAAVKNYNGVCLSIPTVLIARFIGFSKAPYLEFDTSGTQDATALKEFKTDDGERLQQLLSSAGGQLAGATRSLAGHAGQAGKLLAMKIKERTTPMYFYVTPGGVPTGPVGMDDIQRLLSTGVLDHTVQVAEVGSQDWRPIATVATLPTRLTS
jgi:LemA protein